MSERASLWQRSAESVQRRDRWIRIRMLFVGALMCVGFSVVTIRSMDLLLREHESLKWVANKQHRAVIPIAPRRGKIVDTKGRELALDVPVFSLYADPRQVTDPEAIVAAIGRVMPLGGEASVIVKRIRQGKKFAWIKRRLDASVVEEVRSLGLRGVYSVEETKRFYPNGALASQILGAVGYDAEPLGGIELALNGYLANERSEVVSQRDARGRVFYTPALSPSKPIANVELTIDKVIQHYTEMSLANAVVNTQSRSGVAVIVEADTGRILAMASMPSFDPNQYAKFEQARWRNRAITDSFEPGSTFKVFIAAGALEAGMDPERKFDCEMGEIKIGNAILHDHDPYGMLSLRDVIRVSSNIGALKVAQALGRERFAQTLKAFHMGEATGVDFPGEVRGLLRDSQTWQPVEMATIAFGQGVTITPLQMTMAFAAIANGGRLMKPYIVERVRNEDGAILYEGNQQLVSVPIRPSSSQELVRMLTRVVEKGGTGTKAASELYQVAGKTGTAQKVVEGSGHYGAGKFFASFVGFAPANAPRIVVFIGMDEPKGAHFGGAIAAPVFKEIVEATLPYLGVPGKNAQMVMTTESGNPRSGWTRKYPKAELQGTTESGNPRSGWTRKYPKAELQGTRGGEANSENSNAMPDFLGLPIRDVVRRVGGLGLKLDVAGTGIAVEQQPSAGQAIAKDGMIAVRFALPQ